MRKDRKPTRSIMYSACARIIGHAFLRLKLHLKTRNLNSMQYKQDYGKTFFQIYQLLVNGEFKNDF